MQHLKTREIAVSIFSVILSVFSFAIPAALHAQSNSGIVQGTVTDPSKAAVAGATVQLENPVSHHVNQATTDMDGSFRIGNIPFNPYHLSVTAPGFAGYTQDVDVRSTVPTVLDIGLTIGSANTSITVTETADLLEPAPTFHTDVDRELFDRLPLESASSSVSSLITLASPGVVADSNGLFHGLGDHAQTSFSVDGQPITDQQSKVFSNELPADAIQSMEVVSGAPPAEFGEKTSLVVRVTTRSGLGVTQPTGGVTFSYGSFNGPSAAFNLAVGGQRWGNFIATNGLNTERFLDPPEFQVMHSRGNEENVFDRVDFKPSSKDTISINGQFTRSWFQTPNSFDAAGLGTDQHAQITTFNVAPSWARLIGNTGTLSAGAFVRRDRFQYFPSTDPFADQPETLSQNRILTNSGFRADYSYVKGAHNFKTGVQFQNWALNENFKFGVTNPTFNSPCLDAGGDPSESASPTNPSNCHVPFTPAGYSANPDFVPELLAFDLTRGGGLFNFNGKASIRLLALFVQDQIKVGNWTFNAGIRGDIYRGLTHDSQAEPRAGISYHIKPINTVLRFSYARTMETPFNENLVFASTLGLDPAVTAVVGPGAAPVASGHRNEYHAGLQQVFGRYFVVDGDYMWKYTNGAYDFGTLGDTPIFFPIAFAKSKITGFSVRGSVPNFHGLTAFVVLSGVSARYFPPQIGGLGANPSDSGSVFRIDHDQKFQQTTHLQYQPRKDWPWISFNWRYDSGLVAGAVPCAGGSCANGPAGTDTLVDASDLSPDQQFQAGLFCGNVHATPTTPISPDSTCPAALYGSTLIRIPAPGTANDDRNPPRIAPRHLFDIGAGIDNLFHAERYKWSLRFTAINLTNKVALYNFLSTFSGTHYVTPRTFSGEVGFHF